jgi:hypothetical protein
MKHGTICILKISPDAEWEVDIPRHLLTDADITAPTPERDLSPQAVAELVLNWMTEHTRWVTSGQFEEVTDSTSGAVGGQVVVVRHEERAPADDAAEQQGRELEEARGEPGTLGYLRVALAQLAHLPDDMPVVLAATSAGNGFRRLGDVGDGTDPEPEEDAFGTIAAEDIDDYDELPAPCLLLWPC